ncbi:hypothetical protein B0F90DRAFT_685985 [Multifurca ochricompacta]|uniref:SPX domain-containing protein n=1 Tax=Multifurca ochricompacta TaxID=376703 RepID=A0AAD4M373_9AGAM|nr:hypothetical protein B0F90DRAFT_685985 [Multifurca ochricompacta]
MTLARDTQSSPKLEIHQLAVPPSNSRLLGGLRRRPTAQFLQLPSPACSLTLYELLESIPPVQLAFFDKLNHELSKTESFFIAREAEARMRSLQLREQLEELRDHRRLFRDAHSGARRRTSLSFPPAPISDVSKRMNRVLHSLTVSITWTVRFQ